MLQNWVASAAIECCSRRVEEALEAGGSLEEEKKFRQISNCCWTEEGEVDGLIQGRGHLLHFKFPGRDRPAIDQHRRHW